MKILVDEMPKRPEDCPWAYPTDIPWNENTTWFCSWKNKEMCSRCPLALGSDCLFFAEAKSELDAIVDKWNAIPNANPLSADIDWGNCVDTFANLLFTPPKRKEDK